jgi:uncharacterized protein YcbK (DUF882 family)
MTAFNRREILGAGVAGLLGAGALSLGGASAKAAVGFALPKTGTRSVSFVNLHTDESFSGPYRAGGQYIPEAMERIKIVLRDFRTNTMHTIDPRAIDILYALQQKMGQRMPLGIISGYRSPQTNAMLERTSNGVAHNSLHMKGQAIDIRQLGGYDTRHLRNLALSLRAGGVGYYPDSDFVHVDTGKIRRWGCMT